MEPRRYEHVNKFTSLSRDGGSFLLVHRRKRNSLSDAPSAKSLIKGNKKSFTADDCRRSNKTIKAMATVKVLWCGKFLINSQQIEAFALLMGWN